MKLRLGKRPKSPDERDLRFSSYRQAIQLPPHPPQFGHEALISPDGWQMLGNGPDDTVSPGFEGAGDCVFAGACHETMLWTLEGGTRASFTGANAISDYSAVTGYDPADPDSDQGTDVRQALKYRQSTGILDSQGKRHQIGAFLALEPGNLEHLYEAIYLFGAVGIGIQFPSTAMTQFDNQAPWTPVPGAPIDGGHYVPVVARRNYLMAVTWGRIQPMTVQFYQKYCDEAWAILSPKMLRGGKSLEGFNLAQLQADLKALAS